MEESVFDPTYGGTLDDSYLYESNPYGYSYDFSEYDDNSDSFSDPADFSWGDAPGGDSSTVVDPSSGNTTYTYDDGSTLTIGPGGQIVGNTESAGSGGNSVAFNRALAWATRNFGSNAARVMSAVGRSPGASLLTALAAARALSGSDATGGYNKPVPKMDMVREQIQYNDPNRRPGEGGRQYFTDPRFVAQGNADALAAAQAASTAQGQGILAAYQPRQAEAPNPYAGKMNLAFSRPGGVATTQAEEVKSAGEYQRAHGLPGALKSASSIAPAFRGDFSVAPVIDGSATLPPPSGVAGIEFAKRSSSRMPTSPSSPPPGMIKNPEYIERYSRGADQPMDMRYVPEYISKTPSEPIDLSMLPVGLAGGGIADAGRYLRGKTDGMADEIPTSIDGEQPALLSHGEFVIPADVVSHLGNGNSEAGAEKLYDMMDRIRMARTGTKKQGKEIDADKFITAASGGLAAYAKGGEVQKFVTGGMPNTPTPTVTGAGIPHDVSRTSTLSPWVGDYVTNALGQGAALASAPYQAYTGPLTAGASNLQQQAFAGASEMAQAGYTPGEFVGGFDASRAAQYMNPYLQASLDPQLRELDRQSQIQRLQDAGRLTKAGAFGGSRQAIMESEGRRNLLDKQANLIGQGYKAAYDTGLGQFQKEREAEEASRQFGAGFGLKSISQLADLGATQRGITSEGLAADKAQFEEQRDFAYKMPQYQLGLLSGLPIGSNTTSVDQDALSQIKSQITGLGSLYDQLKDLIPTLKTPG